MDCVCTKFFMLHVCLASILYCLQQEVLATRPLLVCEVILEQEKLCFMNPKHLFVLFFLFKILFFVASCEQAAAGQGRILL